MWCGWSGGGCVDNGSIREVLEICETARVANKNSLGLGDHGFSAVGGRGCRRYEDGLGKDQSCEKCANVHSGSCFG